MNKARIAAFCYHSVLGVKLVGYESGTSWDFSTHFAVFSEDDAIFDEVLSCVQRISYNLGIFSRLEFLVSGQK